MTDSQKLEILYKSFESIFNLLTTTGVTRNNIGKVCGSKNKKQCQKDDKCKYTESRTRKSIKIWDKTIEIKGSGWDKKVFIL